MSKNMVFITLINQVIRTSQGWNSLTVFITGTFLITAMILEHGFNQVPCSLCMTQRLFMAVGGAIALAGLIHQSRIGIYPMLATLFFIGGAGFATRQIYLQLTPEASSSCGPALTYLLENDYSFMVVLNSLMSGSGECGDPSLIPAASLVGFILLAATSLIQLLSGTRHS